MTVFLRQLQARKAKPQFVKIYGIQRSGTNWLKYLLETNFRSVVAVDLPLGNKHQAPRPADAFGEFRIADDRPIDVAKLPYSLDELAQAVQAKRVAIAAIIKPLVPWLNSFYRYRRLKDPTRFSEFSADLAAKWTLIWIERNSAFLREIPAIGWQYAIVDYSCLLSDFEPTIHQLGIDLGLTRGGRRWRSSPLQMRRSSDELHGASVESERPFDESYYLSRSYLREIPPNVLQTARSVVEAADIDGFLASFVGPIIGPPTVPRLAPQR